MFRDSARDYLENLGTEGPREGESYTLRVQPQRRRQNPDLDYMKMGVMILGAVIGGIVYDRMKRE